LGHQLKVEIAEKELHIVSYHRLEGTPKILNTTGKIQLSVANVLDGTELLRLQDAWLANDARKAP